MNETQIGFIVLGSTFLMVGSVITSLVLAIQRNKMTKKIYNLLIETIRYDNNIPPVESHQPIQPVQPLRVEEVLKQDNTGIVYEQYVPPKPLPVQPIPQQPTPQPIPTTTIPTPQPIEQPVVKEQPPQDEALKKARQARLRRARDARYRKKRLEEKQQNESTTTA